jgi:hypothetical protein
MVPSVPQLVGTSAIFAGSDLSTAIDRCPINHRVGALSSASVSCTFAEPLVAHDAYVAHRESASDSPNGEVAERDFSRRR